MTKTSLAKYDRFYMKKFPYLKQYLQKKDLKNKKVLEIGLGYGSIGQDIAGKTLEYVGADIAFGPVALMKKRLGWIDKKPWVVNASAVDLPFFDESFDLVYAIGSLHHTGNLLKSIKEVERVLKPGGKAVVMLYNMVSLRFLATAINYFKQGKFLDTGFQEHMRKSYDTDSRQRPAPYTYFTTPWKARRLFDSFDLANIKMHKISKVTINLFGWRRSLLTTRLGRWVANQLGSDFYIEAYKPI